MRTAMGSVMPWRSVAMGASEVGRECRQSPSSDGYRPGAPSGGADGGPKGRAAAWKLHDEIAEIGPGREPRVHKSRPVTRLNYWLSCWAPLPHPKDRLLPAARGDDLLGLLPDPKSPSLAETPGGRTRN